MSEVVTTYEGWYAYHDFRTLDWERWKQLDATTREQMVEELLQWVHTFSEVEIEKKGSFGLYSILGHKADLLWLTLRPTLDELDEVKNQLAKTRFADLTTSTYSYISVIELSAYQARPGVDPETDPSFQARLQPELPKSQYVSFYPMNKKREGSDNWYMLPMEERKAMMRSHGLIGRSYAGKVRQMITGSIGLDDWEWGVTLFTDDPLQFKKIVHEMRFDEASARFGEFGVFYTGRRLHEETLRNWLQVNPT